MTGGSGGGSLPLKKNHDLRCADGPYTRHREGGDDPPALGRIAVEHVLQVLWTELAAPPTVFLRQHLMDSQPPRSSQLIAISTASVPASRLGEYRYAEHQHGGR